MSGLQENITIPEKYELMSKSALEGGQAWVYQCKCKANGELVAIKFFKKVILHSPEARARIEREANAVWKLQQIDEIRDKIVNLVEDPTIGHFKYLVFKWMEGGSLDERKSAMEPLQAAAMVSELATTVELFCEQHMAHRDIKPSNILFPTSDYSNPKISDFGLVRTEGDESLTQVGIGTLGTKGYAAPEGPVNATCRSDVYSLGKVLYFALRGEHPPIERNEFAWRTSLRPEDFSSVSDTDGIGAALRDTIVDCLETNPELRPTASELSDVLGAISNGTKVVSSNRRSFAFQVQEINKLIEMERNSDIDATEAPLLPFRKNELTAFLNFALEQGVSSSEELRSFKRDPAFDDGKTLLHLTIEAGNLNLVRYLVKDLGFDPNDADDSGRSALHVAASMGRSGIVKFLVEDMHVVLSTTRANATVLYEAAFAHNQRGFQDIANCLKHGYSAEWLELLNAKSSDKFTPFLVACWRGNASTAASLLTFSPELLWDVDTVKGQNPLFLATRARSPAIVQLIVTALLEYPSRPLVAKPTFSQEDAPHTYFTKVSEGDTSFFEDLSRNNWENLGNSPINMRESYDRTLLHEAAELGHFNIVQILCKHPDIDVLARNNHGRRPSDLAPRNHRDIAIYLLREEARSRKRYRESKSTSLKIIDRPESKLPSNWSEFFRRYSERSMALFNYLGKCRKEGISARQFEIFRENYFYRTDMTVRTIAQLSALASAPENDDFDALGDISQNLYEEAGGPERVESHRMLLTDSFNTHGQKVFKLKELSIENALRSRSILPEAVAYRQSRINTFYKGLYSEALAASFAQESTAGPMMDVFFKNIFLPYKSRAKEKWHVVSRYFSAHLDSGVEENHANMAFECLQRYISINPNEFDRASSAIEEFLNRQASLWEALHRALIAARSIGRIVRPED